MDEINTDLGPYWAEAVKAYEAECEHPIHITSAGDLRTSDDLLRLIESRGSNFVAFREKHRQLWTTLANFIAPIETMGDLMSEIVSAANPGGVPVAAVFMSLSHLVTAASKVSDAYDWIQTVFSELQNFSDRLRSHARTTVSSAMRRIIISILAFILRIIGRSELLIKRGRISQYFRTAFIGKDQKTLDLLEDLNQVIANEGRLTVALTHEKTEQARDFAAKSVQVGLEGNEKLDHVHEEVRDLAESVRQNARAAQEAFSRQVSQSLLENLQHVLKTTSVAETDDWYSQFRHKLLEGSGSWLQREPFFDTWMQHQAPILWIFGGPGSGKTMLSTWLINLLGKQFEAKSELYPGVSLGYFFLKENVDDLRNPNIMLKTMAWQIQQTDALFRQHAAKACESGRAVIRAEETWENLFLKFYQGPFSEGHRAMLVIDGLDEADISTQRRVLRLLKQYVDLVRSGLPSRIQFAIFGRTTLRPELERVQLDREEKIIEVSSMKNYGDIENFVTERLKNLAIIQKMRRRKPNGAKEAKKFARNIRQKVLDGAGGVFLWAQLLLDQMEGKDDRQIQKVLENPPSDLYDMIFSVFERLSRDDETDKQTTNRLLGWVAFARRPLSFGELDVILRSEVDAPNWFLWDHIRGKFSSIFRLRCPKGWDLDDVEAADTVTQTSNAEEPDGDNATASDVAADDDGAATAADEDDDDDFNLDDSSGDEEDADENEEPGNSEEEGQDITDDDEQKQVPYEAPKVSEADDLYSWAQKHTIVDFSHQRFRDFLIIEGSPDERQKPALPIGIDVDSIHEQLVLDCFRCLRAAPQNEHIEYYVDYPAFHLFYHLGLLSPDKLEPDRERFLTGELYWLMHEEDGCRAMWAALGDREHGQMDQFWRLWLANNHTTSLIQEWFSRSLSRETFEERAATWMQEATKSVAELLKPIAMTAAKIWLTKRSYHDPAYLDKSEFQVAFLNGYRSLKENGEIPENVCNWIASRDLHFQDISTEDIVGLAEWAGLEKTSHWYTGVGWIIHERLQSEHDANYCRELLEKAIEIDDTAWVAMEAMARAISQMWQNYEEAISWMHRAVENLPEHFMVKGYLLSRVAMWEGQLGDSSAAVELAAQSWQEVSASVTIDSYVSALLNIQNWDRVMYVLEYESTNYNGHGVSFLAKWIAEDGISDQLGRVCREKEKPSFIIDALKDALQDVERSGNKELLIYRLLNFGDFCHDYYDNDEDPLAWWEEALSRIKESNDPAMRRTFRDSHIYYTNRAAQLYFDIAVKNFQAQVRPNNAVTKLKQLALASTYIPDSGENVFDVYTPGYPSLLYGRWLRDYENAAPSVWRKCFRARILEQMNGLDDDDPTNDTIACTRVAMSLFHANDEDRAGAILHVVFKTLEDYMAEKQRQLEAEEAALRHVDENPAEEEPEEGTAGEEQGEGEVNDEEEAGGKETGEATEGQSAEERLLGEVGNPVEEAKDEARDESPTDSRPHTPSTDTSSADTPGSAIDAYSPTAIDGTSSQPLVGPRDIAGRKPAEGPNASAAKLLGLSLQLESNAWNWQCNGCLYDAEDKGSMWFCEICYDVSFCGECLEKAKESRLDQRRCNPAHRWYQAWPLNEDKVSEIASSYEQGGKVYLRKEWLEALRNEWLRA